MYVLNVQIGSTLTL